MKSAYLFFLFSCLYGCSNALFPIFGETNRSLYSPKNEIESIPEKKGELLFKANTSMDLNILAQVNVAYSPLKNISVNYNGAFGSLINSHAASLGYYYFKSISETQSNKFSLHLGIAHVPKSASSLELFNVVSAAYAKYWVQNNYEFRKNNITYCAGFSANFIDFRSFQISGEVLNQLPTTYLTNDPFFTLESYFKVRYRKSFYGLDIGLNTLVLQKETEPNFQRTGITTGFFLNINELFTFLKDK